MKNDFKEFMNGFKAMFSDLKTKGRRHKQIPNLITIFRLLLTCLVPLLFLLGNVVPASIVALVALGTDFVDGTAARILKAKSEFGKILDPVCDKLSAAILLVTLMIKATPLITLSLCVNLGLEAGIALVNLNSKAKGNKPETTLWGKGKTLSLSVLLVLSYLSFSIPGFASAIPCIEGITLGLQTITLVDYKRIDKKEDKKRKLIEIAESVGNEETIKDKQPEPTNGIGTKPNVMGHQEPTGALDLETPAKTITDPHALDGLSIEQLNALKDAATGEPTAAKDSSLKTDYRKRLISRWFYTK